jgi:hypothetical protein
MPGRATKCGECAACRQPQLKQRCAVPEAVRRAWGPEERERRRQLVARGARPPAVREDAAEPVEEGQVVGRHRCKLYRWNDTIIARRLSDGWVNLTWMCRAYGKQMNHYFESPRAQRFLDALVVELGGIVCPEIKNQSIARRYMAVIHVDMGVCRGTWAHPRAAVDFAQWLSPALAVWCSGVLLRELGIDEEECIQKTSIVVSQNAKERRVVRALSICNTQTTEHRLLSDILHATLARGAAGPVEAPNRLQLLRVVKYFLTLAGREHPRLTPGELIRRYRASGNGTRALVPPTEEAWAKAAVEAVLAGADAPETAIRAGPSAAAASAANRRGRFLSWQRIRRRTSKGPGYAVKADSAHQLHKDAVNFEFCSLLHTRASSGNVFILDDFAQVEFDIGDDVSQQGCASLRTTDALLRSGVRPEQMRLANPNCAVLLRAQERGIPSAGCWRGKMEEVPPTFFGSGAKPLRAAFVDGCAGSAAAMMLRLRVCAPRVESGGFLAWTLVERDFDGECLLVRVLHIVEQLQMIGWTPARVSLGASTHTYKSSGGQRIVTQFWKAP